jgi:hypothetical protein
MKLQLFSFIGQRRIELGGVSAASALIRNAMGPMGLEV